MTNYDLVPVTGESQAKAKAANQGSALKIKLDENTDPGM